MVIKQYEFAFQVTGLCEALASEVGHRPPLARTAIRLDQNGPTRPLCVLCVTDTTKIAQGKSLVHYH